MKVGSLFAGVGGFDIAAENAGMDILWQSENDKHASETLAEHFPYTPNHGDIHDITFRSAGITGGVPRVDVLVGGFPCQDYSVAGQRDGLAGDRGALWWEFHRLIDEGLPRWVVGENVPGLLSSRGGADFATIIESLTDSGYRVAWRVLDAQYFGVAQRRRRVFIVGHLGDKSPSEVLALAEGLSGYPKPVREAGKEVAERASGGTRTSGGSGLLADTGAVRTLTERYGKAGTDLTDAEGGHIVVGPLTAGMQRGPRGTEAVESNHIMAVSGPLGAAENGPRYDLDSQGAYVPFVQNTRDEVRIFDEDNGAQIVGTLAAEAGMKQQTYLAGQQVRRLTPLECERLQGFPDNWTSSQSDTQRYRQMGNAVAVPVVEWIMKRLAAVDGA